MRSGKKKVPRKNHLCMQCKRMLWQSCWSDRWAKYTSSQTSYISRFTAGPEPVGHNVLRRRRQEVPTRWSAPPRVPANRNPSGRPVLRQARPDLHGVCQVAAGTPGRLLLWRSSTGQRTFWHMYWPARHHIYIHYMYSSYFVRYHERCLFKDWFLILYIEK
jgi:hypothetical protein